jgi:site-specific DNA-methyltransferase (adenine-specific)
MSDESTWRVIEGDCLETIRALDVGTITAVVTDPPYGIGRVWKGGFGGRWSKAMKSGRDKRNAWDAAVPSDETFAAILGLGVPTIIWGGNYFSLPPSRGWLVWTKPERNFSLAEAELAWTNIDTVIRVFDWRRSDKNRTHPTQKPLALMKWCLEQLRLPAGSTVLDPYMGSGTTGVACLQMGLRFIGVDNDPDSCKSARASRPAQGWRRQASAARCLRPRGRLYSTVNHEQDDEGRRRSELHGRHGPGDECGRRGPGVEL